RFEQRELDRSARLLLRHRRSRSYPPANGELTDPDLHEVAATQLAVDGKVEKRPVAKTPFSVELEPDRPNLLRLERKRSVAAVLPFAA
ncbi:MAG TPA: hypothetical protein VE650_20980, partial [Acetobacteraceae bacterium]|nr:hypothetical protein [Acetobacteraceae bacterium]